jgi:Protein of unknown function (DUF3102)
MRVAIDNTHDGNDPISDTDFLCEAADRIRQRMTRTAEDIVEIGRELIAVKDRVGHGNFLPWIEREFRMSEDMAARFMNVARNMATQISQGANFQLSILYALASPSTPAEVRTEITERVVAGETITLADVRAVKTAVTHGRQNGHRGKVSRAEVGRAADRRMVTDGFMAMLDLFERDDIDPAARAAFVIEHFDRDIAGPKLSIKRLSRTIDAVHAVFRSIATDLYETRRAVREGRPEPARGLVVR